MKSWYFAAQMKTILILGAGRSSSSLISYLLHTAESNGWKVVVGDVSLQAAKDRIGSSPAGKPITFDIQNSEVCRPVIAQSDVVISLMPAALHTEVAKLCLQEKKHLLTASYVSDEMKSFHEEARAKDLLFLNEGGLDPGIDHMSAKQVIDRIKEQGGELISFESFTGGLIAPDTDPQNPWRYKFTWNPRNVVIAGQGTARFLQNGQFKYIPYQQLFKRTTPVQVPGYGSYDGYANRDSLKYIETYKLEGIKTMLRGTLRNRGYCSAWNIFVQLGCCDDTYQMEGAGSMTHRDFMNSFLDFDLHLSVEEKICKLFDISLHSSEIKKLTWSGLFSTEKVGLEKGTPAQLLEHILNKKWKLNPDDKDQIVMWHRFVFESEGVKKEIQSSLVCTGDDSIHTAMAKTVGLPLAIAAKLLLQSKISARGVVIPTSQEFYAPILAELTTLGVEFAEVEKEV